MSDDAGLETATSRTAQSSFTLGLMALVFSFFTGLPAVVQGVRGLLDIRRGAGRLRGRGLALAGIATGLAGTSWGVALIAYAVGEVRETADRMH
jgi:hypothetical protein